MRPFRAPWILGAETCKFDDEVIKARLEVVARLLKSRGGFAAFKGASLAMEVQPPRHGARAGADLLMLSLGSLN